MSENENEKSGFRAAAFRVVEAIYFFLGGSPKQGRSTPMREVYLYRNKERIFMSPAGFWSMFSVLFGLLLISTALLASSLHEYIVVYNRSVDLYSSMNESFTLFSVEYENDSGEITVKGQDGSKVVAPGTGGEYKLNFRNADELVLNYSFAPGLESSSGI